jgi:hypothetical protein
MKYLMPSIGQVQKFTKKPHIQHKLEEMAKPASPKVAAMQKLFKWPSTRNRFLGGMMLMFPKGMHNFLFPGVYLVEAI